MANLDWKPTQRDVVAIYREYLGREPESEATVEDCIEKCATTLELRERVRLSEEFKARFPARRMVGKYEVPENWLDRANNESNRCFGRRLRNGFFEKYLSGDLVLDVGYKGYVEWPSPILPHATGVDMDFPGYDGTRLPFQDGTVDTVYSSHTLEHIANYIRVIQDWFRVIKIGGFIVCMVPHKFLYEKRHRPPSNFNGDHARFFTPASLMAEFEAALRPNTYRLRHLSDNDEGFDYAVPPHLHSHGAYEIEIVIQKIMLPNWDLSEG